MHFVAFWSKFKKLADCQHLAKNFQQTGKRGSSPNSSPPKQWRSQNFLRGRGKIEGQGDGSPPVGSGAPTKKTGWNCILGDCCKLNKTYHSWRTTISSFQFCCFFNGFSSFFSVNEIICNQWTHVQRHGPETIERENVIKDWTITFPWRNVT